MRILNIAFRNLNSLAGEWSIDLCSPEFEASGIFAITGPTGAGKSTILDAICLALYGCTPRLGKVSKGANDIMTRGTGDCFADVTFSTQHGEFRCRWSQRRARGRADGELQQAKHELFNNITGLSLADKMHDVAARVEELTGMDFERFTQSALLAQGRFASFLLAEGRDRAPLLEQMTGTEIYSQISAHVFRRCKSEQERLAALDAELASCSVLSEEEELELRESCSRISGESAQLDARENELNAALHCLNSHAALRKERENLADEERRLNEQNEAFAENRAKLETARRALLFAGDCSALLTRQNEQRKDKEEAQSLTLALGAMTAGVEECEAEAQSAEEALANERLVQSALLETLKAVRSLDVQIAEKSEEFRTRETACDVSLKKKERLGAQLTRHENELAQRRSLHTEKRLWLEKHAADSELAARLAELRLAFAQLDQQEQLLAERSRLMSGKKQDLELKTQSFEKLRLNLGTLEQEISALELRQVKLDTLTQALLEGKSSSEWRDVKENLGQRIRQIEELQDWLQRRESLRVQEESLQESISKLRQNIDSERGLLLAEQGHLEEAEQLAQELSESIALLARIQSYEEARLGLKEGEACPLCGSLHHPFALERTPAPDEKEEKLKACRIKLLELRTSLNRRSATVAALERDAEHARALLEEKHLKLAEAEGEIDASTKALSLSPCLPLADRAAQERFCQALESERSESQNSLNKAAFILQEAEDAQKKEAELRTALEQARARHERSRKEFHSSEQECAVLLAEIKGLCAEQESAEARQEDAFSALRLAMTSMGCAVHVLADVPPALRSLGERLDLFQQAEERLDSLSEECAVLEKQLLIDQQELKAVENLHSSSLQEQQALADVLRKLKTERTALFGDRSCDAEEGEAAERLHRTEEHCRACLAKRDEARQKKVSAAARLSALEKKVREREALLAADETALLARLREAGFGSLEACLKASLTDEARHRLELCEQELREAKTSIIARMKDCERRQGELAELPPYTEEELLDALSESRKRKASLLEELGALREKLESNESRKKAAEETLATRSRQEATYRRWADLNELIGSADGKKFRNYAQELTFRVLIGHANRQLRAMTDRYQLVQDPKEALALAVIDRYQADTVRTSRNLSGGESFLVSLALALGLASMASRNVSVDSVFLDEGFGTLDEEALNTALDALASLRQQGKTIGIISHVQAIRERLGTRLLVEPEGNGRSRISGPGVRKKASA